MMLVIGNWLTCSSYSFCHSLGEAHPLEYWRSNPSGSLMTDSPIVASVCGSKLMALDTKSWVVCLSLTCSIDKLTLESQCFCLSQVSLGLGSPSQVDVSFGIPCNEPSSHQFPSWISLSWSQPWFESSSSEAFCHLGAQLPMLPCTWSMLYWCWTSISFHTSMRGTPAKVRAFSEWPSPWLWGHHKAHCWGSRFAYYCETTQTCAIYPLALSSPANV